MMNTLFRSRNVLASYSTIPNTVMHKCTVTLSQKRPTIMADLVVRYTHQKMAAYVGQGWVSLKCSHFPLLFCPKLYVQLFISAFLPHAAVWAADHIWDWSMPLWENPHPNFNLNLILMWQALIVNGFWWNFNLLFIWVVTNSLANLFEINQSLLNCCVVNFFAFVLSKSCSAPQCGEYLRDK